ncbi:MAG TPA: archease [Candidatus Deferrimicrobiaceae bacterium]|nr:archease [Candidatus Deferrimicrobiaceae bacterium]
MKPTGYRLLPHTADIRLEVRGKDLPGLFAESVTALFSLITDRRRVRAAESRVLEASGVDLPDTLYLLLRGALLLFTAEHFIVRSARGTMDASGARVEVSGEPFDGSRHSAFREIKAVTAHGLAVESIPGGYVARFVVDV